MSNYYQCLCNKCKVYSEAYYACGTKSHHGGDFYELGLFIAKHTTSCGVQNIELTDEYDPRVFGPDPINGHWPGSAEANAVEVYKEEQA